MTLLLPALAAFVVGCIVALQPGINSQLAQRIGNPVHAAVLSFSAGVTLLATISLIWTRSLPSPKAVLQLPPWLWLGGGTVGALFVTTALLAAPKLGATFWIALIVAGQLLSSLLLDHYGLLGFKQSSISWPKVGGALLLMLGVLLIAKG
jgi:transporter family-2 protein